jgi:hypothetical protein
MFFEDTKFYFFNSSIIYISYIKINMIETISYVFKKNLFCYFYLPNFSNMIMIMFQCLYLSFVSGVNLRNW